MKWREEIDHAQIPMTAMIIMPASMPQNPRKGSSVPCLCNSSLFTNHSTQKIHMPMKRSKPPQMEFRIPIVMFAPSDSPS